MANWTARRRAVSFVLRVAIACFFVGIAGLFVVPLHFSRATYVSENALQHGLHAVSLGAAIGRVDAKHRRGDALWTESFLRSVPNLEVHNFAGSILAIARSDRGNTASSVLISAHFEPSAHQGNVSAAFVACKLAELFASAPTAGKDILFLFTRREEGVWTLKRFLQMYHDGDASKVLFRRSGAIQQGFHLDFSFKNGVRKLVVEVEGNRLPNLDMVNNFVRCASSKGLSQANLFFFLKKKPHASLFIKASLKG